MLAFYRQLIQYFLQLVDSVYKIQCDVGEIITLSTVESPSEQVCYKIYKCNHGALQTQSYLVIKFYSHSIIQPYYYRAIKLSGRVKWFLAIELCGCTVIELCGCTPTTLCGYTAIDLCGSASIEICCDTTIELCYLLHSLSSLSPLLSHSVHYLTGCIQVSSSSITTRGIQCYGNTSIQICQF